MNERVLIVNADDFGASTGINAGIIDAHVRGIVTSTSLMVYGRAAREAVATAREHPDLSLGLHWDLDSAKAPPLDLHDAAGVRAELARQLELFAELVGSPPTHLDTHHHVHRLPDVGRVALEIAAQVGVPLREDGRVAFVGDFYGQPDPDRISRESLISIVRRDVREGWTELGCHPGFWTDDHVSRYGPERELELAALTDPGVRDALEALGIRLTSYRRLARW